MICNVCGTANDNSSKFCVSCGAVLEQTSSSGYGQSDINYSQQPILNSTQMNYGQQPNVYVTPSSSFQTYITPSEPVDTSLPGKALGIVGMVLGILSLVLCWVPLFGLLLSITGLILSIIGKNKASNAGRTNGMAIAGIICSAIGIGLGCLYNIFYLIFIIENVSRVSRYSSSPYYY